MNYEKTNDQRLVEFRMFGSLVSERALMGEGTRSRAIRDLHAKLSEILGLKLGHEIEAQSET
jgi:hypothetical protein